MWFLVTDFDRSAETVTAVWVDAASPDAAACEGAERIAQEWESDGCDEDVESVFVVGADDRVAYVVDWRAHASVAQLQCCGGMPNGRHTGSCPTAPPELKGLMPPREDEAPS